MVAGQQNKLCSRSALQQMAERLKKDLSASEHASSTCSLFELKPEASGEAVNLLREVRLEVKLDEFHSTCKVLFDRGLAPVERLLTELEMTPDHVDEVVLVGGTTRIPYVKLMLRNYFKKELNDHIDPDVTVAVGAASILD